MSDTQQSVKLGTPIQLQREQLRLKVEEIRGLLAKADARLRETPDDRRRWLSVVENLENSLTEVKARLAFVEDEIQRGVTGTLPPGNSLSRLSLSDSGIRFVDNMLNMSVLDVSTMNIEELAQAKSKTDEPGPTASDRARAEARIELANQTRVSNEPDAQESEIPSQRSQLVLRAAIDKIQSGRIGAMSSEEANLIISCHELMVRRVNPTPSDLRLKRILSGAITILQRRQNEALAR